MCPRERRIELLDRRADLARYLGAGQACAKTRRAHRARRRVLHGRGPTSELHALGLLVDSRRTDRTWRRGAGAARHRDETDGRSARRTGEMNRSETETRTWRIAPDPETGATQTPRLALSRRCTRA